MQFYKIYHNYRQLLFYLNYTGYLLTPELPLSQLVSHTNYSPPVNLLIYARYYTVTPPHALYGRLINFTSTYRNFPLNLVQDRLVSWLLQSGMDYLLISDFHPLSTPSNAVCKLSFSNSPSTPLPCCPPSDCQHLLFSIITELACVINACIIIIITSGQSNLTKSASQGAHSPVRNHPRGRKLYH